MASFSQVNKGREPACVFKMKYLESVSPGYISQGRNKSQDSLPLCVERGLHGLLCNYISRQPMQQAWACLCPGYKQVKLEGETSTTHVLCEL